MNIVQFNALKPGDKIENAMSGSTGDVVEADSKGVTVRWKHTSETPDGYGTTRHYSRYSTIWFHWSLVEAEDGCACGGGDLSGHANECPHK